MKEEFVFFWGGTFSQWFKAKMVINGVEYNCCEQYMMAEKARLFYDEDSRDQIMKAKDPREQKKLGRKVRNFEESVWNEYCRECLSVVHHGHSESDHL